MRGHNFVTLSRPCLPQVDGQRNRTGSSPGRLVGLNVFNQLFVGGYNEYTPELLPAGSRFHHGFQGKTATALLEASPSLCSGSSGARSFSRGPSLFVSRGGRLGRVGNERGVAGPDCV